MVPIVDSHTNWWCAIERATHYAQTYEVRYLVFWVYAPGHHYGGWWMITPH
jgi:hypothetical protein